MPSGWHFPHSKAALWLRTKGGFSEIWPLESIGMEVGSLGLKVAELGFGFRA